MIRRLMRVPCRDLQPRDWLVSAARQVVRVTPIPGNDTVRVGTVGPRAPHSVLKPGGQLVRIMREVDP